VRRPVLAFPQRGLPVTASTNITLAAGPGNHCRDSEPHDRPGHDQSDADAGTDHPPSVHRHDETAIAHRCAVLRPAMAARLVTRWQNNGLATLIMESRGL